ncbi:glycosyltransferase [Thermanaerothrix sp. 4228-RoL]|uniref:Glycosyltransferase n=1 Tax=Thermanaerothrix solaris TaxID=3058434 RepID=A0ABU3NQB3_9CHLR|nr:glycosyltransferase [Thermanaerothrix sp. 4228-RoL]MDT8898585.1 glycosyltransferase [Thermanaerothrix sp. 4228-RoL]
MRVALIGPVYPYRGGIAHYTASLAEAFQQVGHEVLIYSFLRQYPYWLYPGKSDKEPSQQNIYFPVVYTIDTMNPYTWVGTAKSIKEDHPDLVVFQWWTTFMSPAFTTIGYYCRQQQFPVVFLIHNVYPHEKRWLDRGLAWLTLRLGDAFIVQSDQEKNKLLSLLPNARVYLHPHPVYFPFAGLRLDNISAKTHLGLDTSLPVVLFFGIVRPYKGLSLLLEAIAVLKQRGYFIQVLVVGEFWEDINKYQQLIRKLEISDLVYLENRYIPNEEVPLYFSAADIFVAPYISGTQSGAVKLAMGFGLPIVVSDIICDDVLCNSDIVVKFPVRDTGQLAVAIQHALEKKMRMDTSISEDKGPTNNLWLDLAMLFQKVLSDTSSLKNRGISESQ